MCVFVCVRVCVCLVVACLGDLIFSVVTTVVRSQGHRVSQRGWAGKGRMGSVGRGRKGERIFRKKSVGRGRLGIERGWVGTGARRAEAGFLGTARFKSLQCQASGIRYRERVGRYRGRADRDMIEDGNKDRVGREEFSRSRVVRRWERRVER